MLVSLLKWVAVRTSQVASDLVSYELVIIIITSIIITVTIIIIIIISDVILIISDIDIPAYNNKILIIKMTIIIKNNDYYHCATLTLRCTRGAKLMLISNDWHNEELTRKTESKTPKVTATTTTMTTTTKNKFN